MVACSSVVHYRAVGRSEKPGVPVVIRECVSTGAAGAQTRRSLGHHLLHPLILRLLVLSAPTDFENPENRLHPHPQIQIPNAFPVKISSILTNIKIGILMNMYQYGSATDFRARACKLKIFS